MSQLNLEELENLRSQIAASSLDHGGRRYSPYAFTEHGVAMLSSVLKSERAVEFNILIIRAFVRLREYIATHKDLAHKLEEVERTQHEHSANIERIYGYIQQLLEPPAEAPKRRIGFAKVMDNSNKSTARAVAENPCQTHFLGPPYFSVRTLIRDWYV